MNIQEIAHRNRRVGMSYIISFILLIVLTRFFDFLYIPRRLLFYVGIFVLLYFYFKSKQDCYKNKLWIGVIGLMILGSILYSHFKHGQPLLGVAESSYFAMGLASFCVFDTLKLSYKDSVKLIKAFSILFCICYLVQVAVYPIELFSGILESISVNENQFRMRMTCSACSYCLFFWGINNYMINRKPISLLYALLGFFPFIIMAFRSLVLLSALFAIYIFAWHLWKSRLNLIIYSSLLLLLIIITSQLPIVQEKYAEMIRRQESEQTFSNEDYVRYVSLAYYTDTTTKTEMVVGGGVPLIPQSLTSRNHYVSKFCKGYQMKLYWNDLGLIGFGFIFGFPSVILITFLVFRTALQSKEQQLLFIRATLLTIYLGSIFTSQELYRAGNFLFIGLLMYTEYIYHQEKRIHNKLLKNLNA